MIVILISDVLAAMFIGLGFLLGVKWLLDQWVLQLEEVREVCRISLWVCDLGVCVCPPAEAQYGYIELWQHWKGDVIATPMLRWFCVDSHDVSEYGVGEE